MTETPQSTAIQETKSSLAVETAEVVELLKQPQNLLDAMYVLLSIADFDPETARKDITAFLLDRQKGRNQNIWEQRIKAIKDEHEKRFNGWKKTELEKQHESFERKDLLDVETESETDLYCVHCTDYPPIIDDGKLCIPTTFRGSDGKWFRTSIHFSLNHVVEPVSAMGHGSSWNEKKYIIIAPLTGVRELNGNPYGVLPQDTWWVSGTDGLLKLPEGTKIIVRDDIECMQLPGIEFIEANKPYQEAETIMVQQGIKVIYPGSFKGAEKLATQWNSFYGYHGGSYSRKGSESYQLAEGTIESMQDTITDETIEEFNSTDYLDEDFSGKYRVLLQLLQDDYFRPPGFNGFSFSFRDSNGDRRYDADNIIQTLRDTQNPQRSENWEIAKIFEELSKLAHLEKLPYFSPGRLKKRLDKIRDNLEIIPPNLLGAFLLLNYEKIGIK